MSIFHRPYELPAPPAPNGEGTDPLVHMTSVVGRLWRKLAVALNRPESKQEQPSINMVTVKFGGSKGE